MSVDLNVKSNRRRFDRSVIPYLDTIQGLHSVAEHHLDLDPDLRSLIDFTRFASERVSLSHSQIFQDLWALFATGERRDGFFVEFGADDGVMHSNTYLLEKQYGWRGILAEPNEFAHEALFRNRSCMISTDCVYKESGKAVFLSGGQLSGLESVEPDLKERKEARKRYKRFEVTTVTLEDLLASHDAPDEIDFLSIDVEGAELDVLESFDFGRRVFKSICVEHNNGPDRERLLEVLSGNGYCRWHPDVTKIDDWYYHRDFDHHIFRDRQA